MDRRDAYPTGSIFPLGKAIKIDQKIIEAWVNQGYTYGQLKDIVRQSHSCFEATQIDDNYSGAWLCLGNAEFASKQYEDSIKSFTRTIAICKSRLATKLDTDEKNVEIDTCAAAWSNKGDAHLHLNQTQEALDAFEKALSFKKNYKPAIDGEIEARKRLKLP